MIKQAQQKALLAKRTLVSVERLELSTNGLKGQNPESASPIQKPRLFAPVHWTTARKVSWT
jgi:hypothetical protein